MRLSSDRASAIDTDGFKRPKTNPQPDICCGSAGIHNPSLIGNLKPFGIIPTTVRGWLSTRMVEPTAAELPLNSCCHRSYPIKATGSAPGLSSPGRKLRPSAVVALTSCRKFAPIKQTRRRDGPLSALKLTIAELKAESPSKQVCWSLKSSNASLGIDV